MITNKGKQNINKHTKHAPITSMSSYLLACLSFSKRTHKSLNFLNLVLTSIQSELIVATNPGLDLNKMAGLYVVLLGYSAA